MNTNKAFLLAIGNSMYYNTGTLWTLSGQPVTDYTTGGGNHRKEQSNKHFSLIQISLLEVVLQTS